MKIFAAREEDAHQGWVWLQLPEFPARCVVRITNPANRMRVYCEALQIDKNFLYKYNQSSRFSIAEPSISLVIGAWFRAGLGGIDTQSELPLEIVKCNSWRGKFLACTHHPQIVVRLAAWLSGVGLVLGLMGILLGVWSILPKSF